MTRIGRLTLVLLASLAAAELGGAAESGYTPVRVFDAARNGFADFETMVAELGRADVAFVGEEHTNGNTHRLELALLEGLARRRGEIVLSLEMFERDVQETMDHFLMGHLEEADFLRQARAWANYRTAYKPLVDFAAAKSWTVIAANVPAAIAADVSTHGLDVLKTRPEPERAWFAREYRCPLGDDYFRRFRGAVSGHRATADGDAARVALERYYSAQCLKDETMGESVAEAYTASATVGKRPLVVHINGAFHSDYREGVVERTRRRLPDKRLVVVSVIPVGDLDRIVPDSDARQRADYLVYTLE